MLCTAPMDILIKINQRMARGLALAPGVIIFILLVTITCHPFSLLRSDIRIMKEMIFVK